eukprot:m.223627 g.223627  ORF g.223627 m.223627 type:complete len:189 (+) comp18756_c0_seq2:125-691(+)
MAEGGAAGAGLAAAAAVAAEPGAGGVLLGVTEGYATSQNDIVPFPEERIHRYPISDDYEVDLTRPLGDGANGNVYECRHRHRPGMFALKCLPVASPTSRQEINISYHVGLYRSEFVTRVSEPTHALRKAHGFDQRGFVGSFPRVVSSAFCFSSWDFVSSAFVLFLLLVVVPRPSLNKQWLSRSVFPAD